MSATCLVTAPANSTKSRSLSLPWTSIRTLSIRVLGAAGLFLSHVILVRGLGVTGFGEYAEAIAWVQVLCVVGKFGFDNASLRFVSEYNTRGDSARLQGFRQYSRRISLLSCSFAMLAITAAALIFRHSIEPQLLACLLISSAMIPLISVRQIQESTLRGLGLLVESQISIVVWPLSLFVMAALFLLFAPTGLSSPIAVLLHLAAMSLVSLMVYQFLRNTSFAKTSFDPDLSARRQWLLTAAVFVTAELLIGLKSRICIVMAGRLLGSDSAGLYAAMDRFAEVAALGGQSLGFVLAPQFASLFAAGRHADLRRLMRQGSILGLAFTVPVAIGLLSFSDWIFQLLGPSYREGWYLLAALLISICISALSGPSAYVLQMTGRERSVLLITGLCAATNVLCGLLFIGSFGIEGLGLAQVITSCVWAVGMRIMLVRHPAWNGEQPGAGIPRQNLEVETKP